MRRWWKQRRARKQLSRGGASMRQSSTRVLGPERVPKSTLRVVDAWHEAYVSTSRRPVRTLLTALGTILGVGTVVAILGVVSTANQQVSSKFNAILATQVSVNGQTQEAVPLDSETRVDALPGVVRAGVSWQIIQSATVASNPDPDVTGGYSHAVPIYAATPSGLRVMGPDLIDGRLFDTGNEARQDRVAVLGSVAAEEFGITTTANQPAIFIEGVPFTVIGIADGMLRQAGALTGVTIPASTARTLTQSGAASSVGSATPSGGGSEPTMYVLTAPGAAGVVGNEVAYAINPRAPSSLDVITPPDPKALRQQIEGATSTLLLLLALLSLFIGIVAIANTTLLAVLERIGEIGLRRAVGARARHVSVVTLIEAALVGGVGGIIGTSLGVFVVVGVSVAETWTAVIDPRAIVAAPIAGILAGLVAGVYPAWRATRIEPVAALQR